MGISRQIKVSCKAAERYISSTTEPTVGQNTRIRTVSDDSCCNQDGDGQSLPETEENDALHAEELGCDTERLQLLVKTHPKDGQCIQCDKDRDVCVSIPCEYVLYNSAIHVYPFCTFKRPSWYLPRILSTTVATARIGLNCTYSDVSVLDTYGGYHVSSTRMYTGRSDP